MVIDVILLLAAAFLLVTSIVFNGDTAPKFFSHRIYLVETNAFSLVKDGSALITEQAETENIAPGNIIIFSDDSEEARIGEVRESKLEDGVYTFIIRNDLEEEMTIGQSHILGKGIYYSEIIGWLISFALSPAGVCLIAVLPCAAFIVFEIIASLKRGAQQSEFETVKKQDEIPTYLPPRQDYIPPEERPAFLYERDRLMEEAGLFSPPQKKTQQKQEERIPISGRDIDKLIKETRAKHLAGGASSNKQQGHLDNSEYSDYPEPRERQFYRDDGQRDPRAFASRETEDFPGHRDYADSRSRQFREAPPVQRSPQPIIIDENETRNIFEHSVESDAREQQREESAEIATKPSFPSSHGERNRSDDVKRYEPPKRNPPKLAPRVSRLDSLLQEESADSYDIDDILKSIEKNK